MIPPILTKINQKKVISTMEIAWFKTIANVPKTLSKLKINKLMFGAEIFEVIGAFQRRPMRQKLGFWV